MRINANKETVFQSLELSDASKKAQNGLNKEARD